MTEAIVIEKLPNDIYMPGRSAAVKSLKSAGIQLADPTSTTDRFTDIAILVGADQYYNFVYSNKVSGCSIIPSKLGCLVSGLTPNNRQ